MRNAMMMAAAVMVVGCGGQANFEVYVGQLPASYLPEVGQEVYGSITTSDPVNPAPISPIRGRFLGYVVKAELANTTVGNVGYSNVYRLEIDSQESMAAGQVLVWSNGAGKVLKVTQTP